MTNEQLAIFIQQDNPELLPVLWERVKNLCFKLCGEYYSRYRERFSACGVELCDLRQEMYISFLSAVKGYKADDDASFTAYLYFPIRNTAAEMLGIHNRDRINRRPLDNAVSLDAPVHAEDNDSVTLSDIIPDAGSTEHFEDVLQEIADDHARAVIFEALRKLTEQERDVIIGIYFKDKTMSNLAEQYEVSTERIGQIKRKAIRRLRGMPKLKLLDTENRIDHRLRTVSRKNTFSYMAAQRRIRDILRKGEYLTKTQRQRITANTIANNDPVVKALECLGSMEIIYRDNETEIRQRAEQRLTELAKSREVTYGLCQAVLYEERQRMLSDKQRATL